MKKLVLGVTALGLAIGLISFTAPQKIEKITPVIVQQTVKGKEVYLKVCVACHQTNGQGIPGAFPPLAKSDYLNKNTSRSIKNVLNGLSGPITVNGVKYNSAMPNPNLTDQQVADVLTYVYNSWGNNKTVITPAMVKAQRK